MRIMETFPRPECHICFNPFSPRRRPKLLECMHTCCSVCLDQMVLNHREVRCPWCRHITHLSGISVFQLPDDSETLSAVTLAHTPVFIRLPNSSCYLLPLSVDEHTYRYGFKNADGTTQSERLTTGEEEEVEGRDAAMKTSAWTGFCTVLMVAIILIFLLAIVLHNMSCVSKRFNIISCG
ncbi:E3 ubiquitin-protein ligase rnf152 [Silurus meridionalis]|nr:E3 ubiquitin-protein ligase rnf152 [Silurus meridionalis]